MPNENENEKKQPEVKEEKVITPTVEDFIAEVKDKGVSKVEYQKLLEEKNKAIEERNQLMSAIINGDEVQKKAEKTSLADLRKQYHEAISNPDATNLEIATASVELRKALIESGEPDPYVARNGSESDYAAAERVAKVREECIKAANGDPKKFNYIWESRIAEDDPALTAALLKKQQAKKAKKGK